MYDYLVVGAGLFGAVFAREAVKAGKKVLVIDKRPNIAGNVYTEEMEGIQVHKYGAHIFHTNNKKVWDYLQDYAEFNRFTNSPVANYKGELYSLPFNMYTFNKMWGVVTPEEAAAKIEEQKKEAGIAEPKNLEEQAISLVGRDIFEKLVKGYTEKQWGRDCKDKDGNDLPKTVISKEYSSEWKPGDEPYYPVNDEKNGTLYQKYRELADQEEKVIFGGRLGEYKYYDMDAVIAAALELFEREGCFTDFSDVPFSLY